MLPFNQPASSSLPAQTVISNTFPKAFFTGAVATVALVVLVVTNVFDVMPRNTLADCRSQFKGSTRTTAGYEFCDCIHKKGQPLDQSLETYRRAPDDLR